MKGEYVTINGLFVRELCWALVLALLAFAGEVVLTAGVGK